jgi:formate-dependent nitrite reductase membrane component NrfD
MSNLVRQISSSFGIAFLTYVMLHRQDYHAAWLKESVNWSSPVAAGTMHQIQNVLSQAGASPQAATSIVYALVNREAFISGLTDAFIVSAIITALAIPLVFFLGKKQVEAAREAERKRYAHLMPPTGGPPGQGGPGAPGEGGGVPQGAPPNPAEA